MGSRERENDRRTGSNVAKARPEPETETEVATQRQRTGPQVSRSGRRSVLSLTFPMKLT